VGYVQKTRGEQTRKGTHIRCVKRIPSPQKSTVSKGETPTVNKLGPWGRPIKVLPHGHFPGGKNMSPPQTPPEKCPTFPGFGTTPKNGGQQIGKMWAGTGLYPEKGGEGFNHSNGKATGTQTRGGLGGKTPVGKKKKNIHSPVTKLTHQGKDGSSVRPGGGGGNQP